MGERLLACELGVPRGARRDLLGSLATSLVVERIDLLNYMSRLKR
jgi:hypothetical protein